MSKYTTQVRFLCESLAGYTESRPFADVENIISTAAPLIFGENLYPIFDETYRLPLERKILRHYYTREISEETVGLWKLRLIDKLNMIMPYYNQMYESTLLEFNPLYDTDITRDSKRKIDGTDKTQGGDQDIHGGYDTSEQSSVIDTDFLDAYSDTPQGGVQGLLEGVNHGTSSNPDVYYYLTNATHDVTNETRRQNNRTDYAKTLTQTHKSEKTIDTLDDYLEHVKGKTSGISYSKMLDEFRKTFLNIDEMIINELSPLFFGLW